jgi:hypothetical protein
MIKTNPSLPGWIENYAYPGAIKIDATLTDENAFWFLLSSCCPAIFESYAILLHPFKVNWKLKKELDLGLSVQKESDSADFDNVTWKDFFTFYNKKFDINNAYKTHNEIAKALSSHTKIISLDPVKLTGWPPYIYFPDEGNAEYEHLEAIIKDIQVIHGDQVVNYFFFLENTKDWQYGDIMYEGTLSEFEKLKQQDNIDDTPTAIYPITMEWCIVSSIDLPFTYIGGKAALIDKIISNRELEVFKLQQIFNPIS